MDSVVRGAVVYLVLLIVFRLMGKRSLADITTFDAVLLLIISEAIQQALIDSDQSMTNAFLLVLTILMLDLGMTLLGMRSRTADKILNDAPLIIVENGRPYKDRMEKSRVTEDEVLRYARDLQGLERMEQIKYAVLEQTGGISIIPKSPS